jgi:hypothetical protein
LGTPGAKNGRSGKISIMRLKVISCDVLMREVCYSAALSPHTIDLEFTEKGAHNESDHLRSLIQDRIDATEAAERTYDAVLLAYGLCGNSTAGITARGTRLVLPRAHDCCTLFLGSRKRFEEHFRENPSLPFSATGYVERDGEYVRESSVSASLGLKNTYEEYVALYGEENAKYIMETLTPAESVHGDRVVFIDVPEFSHLGYAERCRLAAESEDKDFVLLRGDMRLIRELVYGNWDSSEFLIVEPGETVQPAYDWDRIVEAKADGTSPDQ